MEEFVEGAVSLVLIVIAYYVISAAFSLSTDFLSYILGGMVGLGIGYALGNRKP